MSHERGDPLPLLRRGVHAGFPSPAESLTEAPLDLEGYLLRHREASFLMRSRGDALRIHGIFDNDLLVVDRALTPWPGCVAVMVVDGGLRVMSWPPDRECGQEVTLWGVVRWSIHKPGA